MISTTTQAPSVNLLISSTARAASVSTAPSPLMAARRPSPGRVLPPVPDHAGLGQRETDEDADGEQRDQRLGVAVSGDQQQRGGHRQHPHPVAVHLPLGAQVEQVRQVVVPGQQAGKHRQPAEGGVGRERQQHERDQLYDVEDAPPRLAAASWASTVCVGAGVTLNLLINTARPISIAPSMIPSHISVCWARRRVACGTRAPRWRWPRRRSAPSSRTRTPAVQAARPPPPWSAAGVTARGPPDGSGPARR